MCCDSPHPTSHRSICVLSSSNLSSQHLSHLYPVPAVVAASLCGPASVSISLQTLCTLSRLSAWTYLRLLLLLTSAPPCLPPISALLQASPQSVFNLSSRSSSSLSGQCSWTRSQLVLQSPLHSLPPLKASSTSPPAPLPTSCSASYFDWQHQLPPISTPLQPPLKASATSPPAPLPLSQTVLHAGLLLAYSPISSPLPPPL